MKILVVDDERLVLKNLVSLVEKVVADVEINGFTMPLEALEWLREHHADIALLDIEMSEMNGLTLAKKCKDICPDINIIFVTGHTKYSLEALRLHASGYLVKPVRAKCLQEELENLRHPVLTPVKGRVRIQTFGNFEVFVDKKPLIIPIAKCRECLAYLVDRKGAQVTAVEMAALLWEDIPYDRRIQNNTHRVISDMMKYLKQEKIAEIIIKNRSGMAIDVEMVDCDYYRFLDGDVSQINAFRGEYMTNYSWAEFTLGGLVKLSRRFNSATTQQTLLY